MSAGKEGTNKMNLQSQSNDIKDSGARPTESGRLDGEVPANDSVASPLNQELNTLLETVRDVAKSLETQCRNTGTTDKMEQIQRATHNLLDMISQQRAAPAGTAGGLVATATSQCDVLHIDDDPNSFASVQLLLRSQRKLKVLPAKNGEEGISLAKTLAPRLILLDLQLPDIHGAEVIQRLQKEPACAHIPVVVLSGDSTPSQIERLLVLGARNYLTKPFQVRTLLAVVDELLHETAHPS
jgi:CheY-like chemotaxis protein